MTDSGVEACNITITTLTIAVECTFSNVTSVLGFQITAQINNMDDVDVLYVSSTTDIQSPVTVDVPGGGEYMVTVLPNRAGRGILDTMVEFSRLVLVDDVMTTTSETPGETPI